MAKPIVIGVGASLIIFVLGISSLPGSGFAGLFLMPVIFLVIGIILVGSFIASFLLKANKISENGANPKTIRNILLIGLLVFILIVLKTFWSEIFR